MLKYSGYKFIFKNIVIYKWWLPTNQLRRHITLYLPGKEQHENNIWITFHSVKPTRVNDIKMTFKGMF